MFDTLDSKLSIASRLAKANACRCVLFKKTYVGLFVAIILAPCIQEALALDVAQMPSELKDGGFVVGELPLKDSERVICVVAEHGKSVGERGLEFVTS